MANIAGIDVGNTGAIAILDKKGNIVECVFMPVISYQKQGKKKKTEYDEPAIKNFLLKHKVKHCGIEKAQTMPGQGISSMGNYMMGYGILRGICTGIGVPYTLIHPKTWKKKLMMDMGQAKGESIVRVKQLYPDYNLPLKKDHGKADSILIAKYLLTYVL